MPQEPQYNLSGIPRAVGPSGTTPPDAPPVGPIPLGTTTATSTAGLNLSGIPRLAPAKAPPPGGFDPNLSRELATKDRGTLAGKVIDSLDPRTPAGRMNLGTTAVGIGLAPFTGGTAPWILRILGPVLGTAAAGTLIETGEQVAGVHPPSTRAALIEGGLQGAYEVAGHAFVWPFRRGLTYLAAPRVARQAGAGLRAGVETAQTTATEANDVARAQGEQYLNTVRLAGRAETRAAKAATGAERAEIERVGAEDLKDLQRQYAALYSAPPDRATGQQAVRAVVRRGTRTAAPGPAQRALDMAGEQVAASAETGPPIAVAPLQASLDRMIAAARPAELYPAKSPPGLGFLATIRARKSGVAAAATGVTAAEQTRLQQLIAKELGITDATHPLPGILGRVAAMSGRDSLTFTKAHQLKKLLYEAVSYDKVSREHLEQITKGLAGDLRDMLAVHEPYNVANAVYEDAVKLYRKGVGQKLIKAATDDPDQVVKLLDEQNHAQAEQVKRLLVEQSAKGGDAATGWQAWQAVQSAYTYETITKGGMPGLSQRVAKLLTETPEFARVVYGDVAGQRVLSNLDALGTAWTVAEDGLKTDLAEHVVKSKVREQVVKDRVTDRGISETQARATSQRATALEGQNAVDAARARAVAFRQSRTGGQEHKEGGVALDALYATMLPGSYVAARSIMRVLGGPNASELAQFISHSDKWTRRAVLALNSRLPDAAVAALVRDLATIRRTELTPPAPSGQNSPR